MVNLYCLFYYINYSNDNEAYIVLYQILMIFGVPQDDYRSGFDYFPIFPWITVYSFGVVMNIKGNKGKEEKTSRFYKTISFLPSIIGKNSLYVYIFHIPIIIYTLMIIYICL